MRLSDSSDAPVTDVSPAPRSRRGMLLLASLAGLCWAGALAMLLWGVVIGGSHTMHRNAWYIIW